MNNRFKTLYIALLTIEEELHIMPKSHQKLKILIQFIIPYLILLALFIGASVYVYAKVYDIVENKATEYALTGLTQTMDLVDRRFDEIQSIASQISFDTKVQSFRYIERPFFEKNTYKVYELTKRIHDYPLIMHFIIDSYILYPESDITITNDSAHSFKQLYDLKFQYKDITYEQWRAELDQLQPTTTIIPERALNYNGTPYSTITYLQPLSSSSPKSYIMFLLNNEEISSMLTSMNEHEYSYSYILDQNNQLISSSGYNPDIHTLLFPTTETSEFEYNNVDMFVTQKTSPINGWRYISVQPKELILEEVLLIKRIYIFLISFIVIVGLLATLYFSYINSRGIFSIIDIIKKKRNVTIDETSIFSMKHIAFILSNLVYYNESLEDQLEEQLPLLRGHFLNHVLHGQFATSRELLNAMQHVKINWNKRFKGIAIMYIDGFEKLDDHLYKELLLIKIEIKNFIKQCEEVDLILHELNETQFVLFINVNGADQSPIQEKVQDVMQQLVHVLRENIHAKIRISVGKLYESVNEFVNSNMDAQKVFQVYKWNDKDTVVHYDQLEEVQSTLSYYYPTDMEQRLKILVSAGNSEEIERLLDQLFEDNLHKMQLPISYKRLFYTELLATLLKCLEAAQLSTELTQRYFKRANALFEPKQIGLENFKVLKTLFVDISKEQHYRKKSNNTELKQKIITFIDENYSRQDISLTLLAELFGQSETYLSYFIKEQMGINFSDYVIDKRMTKAKALLHDEDLPIQFIAEEVGYISHNSFSRAFKRLYGISATDYRKSLIK